MNHQAPTPAQLTRVFRIIANSNERVRFGIRDGLPPFEYATLTIAQTAGEAVQIAEALSRLDPDVGSIEKRIYALAQALTYLARFGENHPCRLHETNAQETREMIARIHEAIGLPTPRMPPE